MKICHGMWAMVFFLTSCITAPKPSANRHFVLSNVEKIRPGVTKKVEVLSLLGKPDRHLDLREATPMRSDNEAWSYLEAPYAAEDRVTVEFPPGSDIVVSVGWDVRDGEPESQLEVAEKRYPNATFKTQPFPQINPHTVEHRFFYKDERLGILIIYDASRKRVDSISWMEPKELARSTSLENFQYPDFCIQNHCAHSSPKIERRLSGN